MRVYAFLILKLEYHISILLIVEKVALDILNHLVRVESLNAAHLQLADIQHVKVIQPFVPVESTKNVDLIILSGARRVPLSRLRDLQLRVHRRNHPMPRMQVQYEEVIRSPRSIVTPENVDVLLHQVRRMPSQSLRKHSARLDLAPLQSRSVEYVQVVQVLSPAVPSEQNQPRVVARHCVRVTGRRN